MIHPDYNEQDSFVNDVMVLKITSPSSLPTIALNDDTTSPSGGEDVTAIGLGVTDVIWETVADALQKATLQIIAHDQCAADYDVLIPDATIDEDVMLCAGMEEDDKAACNGDSGGPLLQLRNGEYVQV
jgi:secreted trypsin-like serine protease